ncbi:hypothetical protein GARC_0723 [Paraglaciecola arctica BSs20135]|uniref:Uncharacterized protein n=1 Tax=Paraglaciecola arctica BSs20135 TaxID=493475 RepID=K6XAQ0_9ALTE|nr:hypothetical protein GARC_0723 [Paraglaciecola arctica BSs20135]
MTPDDFGISFIPKVVRMVLIVVDEYLKINGVNPMHSRGLTGLLLQ